MIHSTNVWIKSRGIICIRKGQTIYISNVIYRALGLCKTENMAETDKIFKPFDFLFSEYFYFHEGKSDIL